MHIGGNFGFSRVYVFATFVEKNWLFTEIKHLLFRKIWGISNVYFLAKAMKSTGFSLRLFMLKSNIVQLEFSQSNTRV